MASNFNDNAANEDLERNVLKLLDDTSLNNTEVDFDRTLKKNGNDTQGLLDSQPDETVKDSIQFSVSDTDPKAPFAQNLQRKTKQPQEPSSQKDSAEEKSSFQLPDINASRRDINIDSLGSGSDLSKSIDIRGNVKNNDVTNVQSIRQVVSLKSDDNNSQRRNSEASALVAAFQSNVNYQIQEPVKLNDVDTIKKDQETTLVKSIKYEEIEPVKSTVTRIRSASRSRSKVQPELETYRSNDSDQPSADKSESVESNDDDDGQQQFETEYYYQDYNVFDKIFYWERENDLMHELYKGQSFAIRKKANYPEKIFCGLLVYDNVYKLYEWDEDQTEKGLRLMRFEQKSSKSQRFCCLSYKRGYRTRGDLGNKSREITKSLRPFRFSGPCSHDRPLTAVFDHNTGYLGRVEVLSMWECILFCQRVKLNIYDHRHQHIYTIKFPAANLISYFGTWPWEKHEKMDIVVSNKIEPQVITAVVRKQWSYFCKEKCSNGGHWYVKFAQRPIPWNHKQLIFEGVMMLDMVHYNSRFVWRMECCFISFFGFIALCVYLAYLLIVQDFY